MKIQVTGQDGHLPFKEIETDVIPRKFEVLEIDEESYIVTEVIHDMDNEVVRLEVE